jgi:hypothetical protein
LFRRFGFQHCALPVLDGHGHLVSQTLCVLCCANVPLSVGFTSLANLGSTLFINYQVWRCSRSKRQPWRCRRTTSPPYCTAERVWAPTAKPSHAIFCYIFISVTRSFLDSSSSAQPLQLPDRRFSLVRLSYRWTTRHVLFNWQVSQINSPPRGLRRESDMYSVLILIQYI